MFVFAALFVGATVARTSSLRPEDVVIVIFEFDVASDDSISHVHVLRCERFKGHAEVKNVLTDREKQVGVKIVSKQPSAPDPILRGKKGYSALAFDLRVRKYLKL
jgi:hypothetical protein